MLFYVYTKKLCKLYVVLVLMANFHVTLLSLTAFVKWPLIDETILHFPHVIFNASKLIKNHHTTQI